MYRRTPIVREGVKDASEHHKVTVVVTVFGRPVDVVVDHWHVDKV